jgi:hypothetical protein
VGRWEGEAILFPTRPAVAKTTAPVSTRQAHLDATNHRVKAWKPNAPVTVPVEPVSNLKISHRQGPAGQSHPNLGPRLPAPWEFRIPPNLHHGSSRIGKLQKVATCATANSPGLPEVGLLV